MFLIAVDGGGYVCCGRCRYRDFHYGLGHINVGNMRVEAISL